MIIRLYAVKDELNGFMAPMHFPNAETAIRAFRLDAETNPLIKNNPQDYNIYYIGDMETTTGQIFPAHEKFLNHPIPELLTEEEAK